jgi:DMSO/TMAO reductase YedYZ molybdopterin-dependent catalytic subunit
VTKSRLTLGAAAGLLSAAAGVGAATAIAALVGGAPTPTTAVGNRVVDATPPAVKDWAVTTLGTADKPALLTGIFAALAVLAAGIGVIAFRRRAVGLALATGLGLLGLAAALADRGELTGVYARIMPAVVAMAVSVAMLAWFTRTPAEADSPRTPLPPTPQPSAAQPPGFDRRSFLAAALASGAVAATGLTVPHLADDPAARSRAGIRLPAPTDPAPHLRPADVLDGVDGITPYLTCNSDFYRVDTALSVPHVDAAGWRLRIHGMVDREVELTYADLLDLPLVERRITLTCVSNEVGGEYVGNATWVGVRVGDLLERAGVRHDADAVRSTAVDGFTVGTPLSVLTDGRDALLAVAMNGEPLPFEHGFPVRMVVPGLYGYVSATKWLVDLEVTRFEDVTAYWTDRGWAEEAPVKTMSRIDVPGPFDRLPTGRTVVAGVAWAQHVGIRTVEVRVDEGRWRQARLAAEDAIDTWRQWVLDWDATPGDHTLEVRATDRTGYTQTSHRVPPRPDGATGWHSVVVTVGDG